MLQAPDRSFLDQPHLGVDALRPGDAVIFGAGYGTPYPARGEVGYTLGTASSRAPEAVRAAINQSSTDITHWDFDLGGPLLPAGRRLQDVPAARRLSALPGSSGRGFDVPVLPVVGVWLGRAARSQRCIQSSEGTLPAT